MPPYLRPHAQGVYLSIRLVPRASRNEIGDAVGQELKIKVTAPPVDSAANEALVQFLAEQLGCARSTVQLVRGQTSRHKLVFLAGLEAEKVAAALRGNRGE